MCGKGSSGLEGWLLHTKRLRRSGLQRRASIGKMETGAQSTFDFPCWQPAVPSYVGKIGNSISQLRESYLSCEAQTQKRLLAVSGAGQKKRPPHLRGGSAITGIFSSVLCLPLLSERVFPPVFEMCIRDRYRTIRPFLSSIHTRPLHALSG